VFKNGRWREFGILPFYIYAVLLVLLRIATMIGYMTSYETRPTDKSPEVRRSRTGYEVGGICIFLVWGFTIAFGYF